MSFDAAIETLRSGVAGFSPLRVAGRGELAFYPSRLRNPIIEAGAGRKLQAFTYDGTRVVEPYSLVFKRRKDGVAQEYFYAWDRTGGVRSGPGIKTFLHQKSRGCA